MISVLSKKISLIFLAALSVSLVCGCETINAFNSGSVRFDDVKIMTRAENLSTPGSTRPAYISTTAEKNRPVAAGKAQDPIPRY